jgi:hypothetical protein
VSHSTFVRIINVTIERRHKYLTVGGEEEGRCDCGIGVIHGGIPHGGSQYPWPEGGGGVLKLWPGWLEAVVTSIQLEAAVVATSKAPRLRETLPTASRVLDPYENPVT